MFLKYESYWSYIEFISGKNDREDDLFDANDPSPPRKPEDLCRRHDKIKDELNESARQSKWFVGLIHVQRKVIWEQWIRRASVAASGKCDFIIILPCRNNYFRTCFFPAKFFSFFSPTTTTNDQRPTPTINTNDQHRQSTTTQQNLVDNSCFEGSLSCSIPTRWAKPWIRRQLPDACRSGPGCAELVNDNIP